MSKIAVKTMRVYLILLFVFFVACDSPITEQVLYPIALNEGERVPEEAQVTPQTAEERTISLPITDDIRNLVFEGSMDLIDEIIEIEATERVNSVDDKMLDTVERASAIIPEELTYAQYTVYKWLLKWEIREGQQEYYTRYIMADEILILGNDNVTEDEFRIAQGIVLNMTSKRNVLREKLSVHYRLKVFGDRVFRVVIIPQEDTPANLPEFVTYPFDYVPLAVCSYYCAAPSKWGWGGFVHEMGHALAYAIEEVNPQFNDNVVKPLYKKAMAAGKYEGKYASANYLEYWAESVKFWVLPTHFPYGDTRVELKAYDPEMYAILQKWLPREYVVLE